MTTVEKKKPKKDETDPTMDGSVIEEPAKATAKPKPGDADFDWQTLYPGEQVFTYTHDGVTIGLAGISTLRQPSIGFLRESRRKPEFEQVLDMLEFVACDETLALVDGWVPSDLLAMWAKWSEWNRSQGE